LSSNEVSKYAGLLDKLEERYRKGEVSSKIYENLRKEYEEKIRNAQKRRIEEPPTPKKIKARFPRKTIPLGREGFSSKLATKKVYAVIAIVIVAVVAAGFCFFILPPPYRVAEGEATIGRGGGCVYDGSANVTIPADALVADIRISVRVLNETTLPTWPPPRTKLLGAAALHPDGLVFMTNVTITIPLSEPRSAGVRLSLWVYDQQKNEFVETGILAQVNVDGLTACGKVAHFSTYAIFAQAGGEHLGGLCFSNFTDIFVKNGRFNATFVLGENAPKTDIVGSVMIGEKLGSLFPTSIWYAIYDTTYASSDLVEGPLVIIGRPDTNLFWQKFNINSSWAYFSIENGKYFIETLDGHEYRNSTNITWAIVQLIWDEKNNRPVLLIGGLDAHATYAACYWFAHNIDYVVEQTVHAFILKIASADVSIQHTL